jgi:hypothetical protein
MGHIEEQGIDLFLGCLKQSLDDQRFLQLDAKPVIDVEQGDGDAADWRPADEIRAIPAEMRCPFVAAGIEEGG